MYCKTISPVFVGISTLPYLAINGHVFAAYLSTNYLIF